MFIIITSTAIIIIVPFYLQYSFYSFSSSVLNFQKEVLGMVSRFNNFREIASISNIFTKCDLGLASCLFNKDRKTPCHLFHWNSGSAFYVDYHCFKFLVSFPDSLKFGTEFFTCVYYYISVHLLQYFAVPMASKMKLTSQVRHNLKQQWILTNNE